MEPMFAVIKTGGKQYKVSADDVVKIERLEGDKGGKVVFNDVLMLGTRVGTPTIAGARVEGEIVEQGRGDKITIIKKRRRQGYRRKKGHRQEFTAVKITAIAG
ncbi:MAG TPA: 50S ribosomal protein L21 [Micropepsaceae bacterium]|nr:50S ribosomal protein L21 [Micropepsaceae bacterium]